MRPAVLALCLIGITQPAFARYLVAEQRSPCDVAVPHFDEPSVKYTVKNVDRRTMDRVCPHDDVPERVALACTFQVSAGYWAVYVINTASLRDLACLVSYEKAHMPPHFWGEPNIETPATIQWLAQQKNGAH